MLHLGVCFLIWDSLSGLDLSCLCLGFQERQFYLSGGFSELLGRWVGHLKFCLFLRTVGFYLGRGATWVVGLVCF